MVQGIQRSRRLRCRRNIAGEFILESDDQIFLRGLLGKRPERRYDPVETFFRLDGTPVGKDSNYMRSQSMRDLERTPREPILILKAVLGGKAVLLKSWIYGGRIRQHALEQW